MELEHLAGIFFILAVGTVIAFVFLGIERVIIQRKKIKNKVLLLVSLASNV